MATEAHHPDILCRDVFSTRSLEVPTLPWDRFSILKRFLTLPGPVEGPWKPKTPKNLRLEKITTSEFWDSTSENQPKSTADPESGSAARKMGGWAQINDDDPRSQTPDKIKTEVFCRFRLPGALNGPRGRQKTTQDEKRVLGMSGLPGTTY